MVRGIAVKINRQPILVMALLLRPMAMALRSLLVAAARRPCSTPAALRHQAMPPWNLLARQLRIPPLDKILQDQRPSSR